MKIVNIVATAEMDYNFDLNFLLNNLPNAEKTHMWVKIRIPPYNKYVAFYRSGKFLITGAKSEEEVVSFTNNVVNFLKEHNVDNDLKKINFNNYVLLDSLDFDINLDDLIMNLTEYNASYEPEQFPGMNFKDERTGLTFLLFNSGKITITGVKSLDCIEDKVNSFKELIREKSLN